MRNASEPLWHPNAPKCPCRPEIGLPALPAAQFSSALPPVPGAGGHEVSALPRRTALRQPGCLRVLPPDTALESPTSLSYCGFRLGFASQNPVWFLESTLWLFSHYRQYFAPQTFLKFIRILSVCLRKTPGFLRGAFNQNTQFAWPRETAP